MSRFSPARLARAFFAPHREHPLEGVKEINRRCRAPRPSPPGFTELSDGMAGTAERAFLLQPMI